MTRTGEVAESALVRRHTSAYASGRVVGILAQVATVVVVSRVSGDLYLDYSLIVAATLAATGLSFGWERQAMLRRSAPHQEHENDLPPGTLLRWFVVSGLLSALVCTLLVTEPTWPLLAGVLAMATTYAASQFASSRMQATLRPYRSVALESLRLATTPIAVLALIAVRGSPSLTEVVWVTALANAWPSLLLLKRHGTTPRPDLRADLAFGLPIAVWLLMSAVLQYSDRWVLAQRVGRDVAAEYAATTDLLTRGTASLMAPLVIALHPLIMSAARDSTEAWRTIVTRGFRAQAVLVVVALGGGWLFVQWGEVVVPHAITDWPVVFALILSGAAWQVVLLWHKPFEISGRTGLMAVAMGVAVLVNLAANWTLAAPLGPTFVALANGLSIVVYAGALLALAALSDRARARP